MMRRYAQILYAALFATMTQSVWASPAIDPTVIYTNTGGRWDTTSGHGLYRVTVWNAGFEHVSSGVVAEWVADPQDSNESSKVIYASQLVELGLYSFQMPIISQLKEGVRIKLKGVNTYQSNQRVSCIFELKPSKLVITVRPCAIEK